MTKAMQDSRLDLVAVAKELRDAALDVVWRQWGAIGGQAAAKGVASAIVDPEALILMSASLEKDEPRLTDIMHDWMVLNSDLISVQRAKNLSAEYPPVARERLSWLAHVAMAEAKDLRWRPLSGTSLRKERGPIPRTNKRRAVRARLSDPAVLLLRLRRGIGVGAKADALAFLLGADQQWSSVRDIVSATRYTVAAVRRATEDMAAARLIHARSSAPSGYRVDRDAWRELLEFGLAPPPWRSWHERFVFVSAFLAWANEVHTKSLTPYVVGVRARELIERHRAAFETDLVAVWNEQSGSPNANTLVERTMTALATWLVASA